MNFRPFSCVRKSTRYLSWPNIPIRSLSGQSPNGVIDFEWLIVEWMCFFGQDRVFTDEVVRVCMQRLENAQTVSLPFDMVADIGDMAGSLTF